MKWASDKRSQGEALAKADNHPAEPAREQSVPERLLKLFETCHIAPPHHLLVLGSQLNPNEASSALLISRQPRALAPDTPWLRSVFEHFSAKTGDPSFVGTLGQAIHEAPLWAAANSHMPVTVVLPQYVTATSSPKAPEKAFAESLALIRDLFPPDYEHARLRLILPVWPTDPPPSSLTKEGKNHRRDLVVAGLASNVFILGVSPSGTIHRIVEVLSAIGCQTTPITLAASSPAIEREPVRWPAAPASTPCGAPVTPGISVWNEPGWLSHYVRSCTGHWPGQTRHDYFSALSRRDTLSAHSAFDTLRRILNDGIIRGSDKWVRGDWPVISFTESTPAEVRPLHRYMHHLVRWDFEPYSIRIRRTAALSHGAMQVAYIDNPGYWRGLPQDKLWWFQPKLEGRDIALEKEWRFKGNLLLKDFAPSDIRLLVPTNAEAETLRRESPFAIDTLEST